MDDAKRLLRNEGNAIKNQCMSMLPVKLCSGIEE